MMAKHSPRSGSSPIQHGQLTPHEHASISVPTSERVHRARLWRGLLGLGHGRSFGRVGALLRRCLTL